MSEPVPNEPGQWQGLLPRPQEHGHKYDRGYVAVLGAPELTGATRLAAQACNRIGAGLVSVVSAQKADVFRSSLSADIMVQASLPEKADVLLAGPGGFEPAALSQARLHRFKATVLDASALLEADALARLGKNAILTPHWGEFRKIFPGLDPASEDAAVQAARGSGAVVVLKGARTTIADPQGRAVVNTHSSPYLAKAGTGDVLAGMIAGLVAQGMPSFEACCAAVWMHGEASLRLGAGLIASDLEGELKAILQGLLASG